MANNVFANGREVSCKKADGKTICAFPDICMTPPTSPATPTGVPVPYPNTGMAKDTTSGSRSVKVSGNEIMLRDKSYYKTSYGDEAGCATPSQKGIITGTIKGKVYFTSWSMDVKAEGKNVVRHIDTTTHNHGSSANEVIPWAHIDTGTFATSSKCKKDRENEKRACKEFKPEGNRDACEEAGLGNIDDAKGINSEYVARPRSHSTAKPKLEQRRAAKEADRCISARRCRLQPYSETKRGKGGCCPAQTGNHIIPQSYFKNISGYNGDNAPTMCVTGTSWHSGNHQYAHTGQSVLDGESVAKKGNLTIRQAAKNGASVTRAVFPESGCRPGCIQQQLEQGHQDMGLEPSTQVRYKSMADAPEYVNRTAIEVMEKMNHYRSR